ncbi:NUDIX hydrolase [Gynurincola endophyticus]|jgi:8-oxo-dGTP diphosphatase|uniref:NUDIX hydrolase n=1 Tax=Gynurincola endophyticus TaxID=2479004 RepID=UPI000F8CF7DE|nr:NUDIX domain-containing protein [Gynurincola endophyticus]
MLPSQFTIRVYGILQNEQNDILVSDEIIRGHRFTKFPGGGLEMGEGTRDCLMREFMEEVQLKIEVQDHLYTTDFYQQSAFNPMHQIISIYYKVKALEPIKIPIKTAPFDFSPDQLKIYEATQQIESIRWVPWTDFNSNTVNLPIDKIVASLIKTQ